MPIKNDEENSELICSTMGLSRELDGNGIRWILNIEREWAEELTIITQMV